MTDNRALVNEEGEESVWVSRADGLGINLIRKRGIPQLILSTETNPVITARARKLNLPVIQGIEDKRNALENYCRDNGYDPRSVVYVGNDINDLDAMKYVQYRVAPRDAHYTIKKIAFLVLRSTGGHGVVRELADRLL